MNDRTNGEGQASAAVQALIDEADAASRHSNRAEACALYEKAVRALRGAGSAGVASMIFRRIGRSFFDDGALDAAEDCFTVARAVAEADRCLPGIAHAVNCQALVYHVRGDLDRAAENYRWAFKRAELAGEAQLACMIHQNMGTLANVQGDLTGALEHYRKALEGYRSLGMKSHLGPLWNNIGRLQTDLRMWEQAVHSFERAREETTESGQVTYQVLANVSRARMWTARGDHIKSREACDAAFELACQVGDERWLGEIHKEYGVIYRDSGKYHLAIESLRQAEGIAETRGDQLLAADTAAEMGILHQLQGDNRATLKYLLRAHRLYEDLQARREIANVAARKDRFEAMFLETVAAWGLSIDAKDPYTQGHCTRVTEYACRLVEQLGLVPPEYMIWFRMGGLLHDVGKVAVPDEILNKPGRLEEDEWKIMQGHAAEGAELIADIEFPWDVQEMVRHHHERWDGSGYPDGLAGEDIPQSAQALSLADAFDAMTTDRSYRAALSADEALARIREESGGAFNPELVEAFCEVVVRETTGSREVGASREADASRRGALASGDDSSNPDSGESQSPAPMRPVRRS